MLHVPITAQQPGEQETVTPSSLYYILHRDDDGYSELCAQAGKLSIRRTKMGTVIETIPLGDYDVSNIEQLQRRLEQLLDLLEAFPGDSSEEL